MIFACQKTKKPLHIYTYLNIENLDTPIVKLKFLKISEKVKTDSNISILSEINNFDTLPKHIYIYTHIHKSLIVYVPVTQSTSC